MTSHDSEKPPGTADLQALEQRLARLENEVAFLREHGLSEDEQSHVLDGRVNQPAASSGRSLLPLVVLANAGLVAWCSYLSWMLWHPAVPNVVAAESEVVAAPMASPDITPPAIAPLLPEPEKTPEPEIQNPSKIEDFSLPPRTAQP